MEKSLEKQKIIEAALFMSTKPLSVADLAKLLNIAAIGYVTKEIKTIQKQYEDRNGPIQIFEENGKYIMTLKAEYAREVKDFAKEAEINPHALKTLGYIAKRDGILKSDLCKKLGSTIYQDVIELNEKGFITQKKSGRTKKIFLTQKFKDYFKGEL
ncbi:SMC-Scp complex subunit ScpB [Candidatus Micrarchaeota archaeon]|nr:SMC-Scp complex subunit ScpB [Candidatus Micrarchaeota archaeon]